MFDNPKMKLIFWDTFSPIEAYIIGWREYHILLDLKI